VAVPKPQNPKIASSVRHGYESHGVRKYYQQFGSQYRNPHEKSVELLLGSCLKKWQPDLSNVLDLACGSGEASVVLARHSVGKISGIDPFTGESYRRRTGLDAEPSSFESIERGDLKERRYSLIVCSYAMHLVPKSRLPRLAYQLAVMSPQLLLIMPHKRPVIRPEWGWRLVGEDRNDKARARWYERAWEESLSDH